MTEPHESFWAFSLQIYAKPGVAEACLELQDKCDADVNLLLFMLWLGYQGRCLNAQEFGAIVDFVKPWQEGVVRPLRLARRSLKSVAHDWQSEETALLRQPMSCLLNAYNNVCWKHFFVKMAWGNRKAYSGR